MFNRCTLLLLIIHISGPLAFAQHNVNDLQQQNRERIYRALNQLSPGLLDLSHERNAQKDEDNLRKVSMWATTKPQAKPSTRDPEIMGSILENLHPDLGGRVIRAMSATEEITQQPAKIQLTDGQMIDTPQKVLTKTSLTLTGAQLFATSDQVAAEVDAWTKAGGRLTSDVSGGYCRPNDETIGRHDRPDGAISHVAHCLIRDRKRDLAFRFTSGVIATLSYSENSRVRNGYQIPVGTDAAFANNQFSGSVTYDPSKLFHTGGDWKNAESAGEHYELMEPGPNGIPLTVSDEITRLAVNRCYGRTEWNPKSAATLLNEHCVGKLAGLTGWGSLWPVLFPQVTFKEQTQFDFIRNGNIFSSYSGLQPSLATLTFSVDLGKVFTTGKNRQDALSAIVAMQKPPKPLDPSRVEVQRLFAETIIDESRLTDEKWVKDFLNKIAAVMSAEALSSASASQDL